QREFRCNHVRWIVSRWCPLYARTQRRCPPHVTHCEYRYVLLYCFFPSSPSPPLPTPPHTCRSPGCKPASWFLACLFDTQPRTRQREHELTYFDRGNEVCGMCFAPLTVPPTLKPSPRSALPVPSRSRPWPIQDRQGCLSVFFCWQMEEPGGAPPPYHPLSFILHPAPKHLELGRTWVVGGQFG
ncbi:hypothetical protein LX32DRAFT_700922, partial [Colletotrichum zoysiae]